MLRLLMVGFLIGCQEQPVEPACSDGSYGAITQPGDAVHVRSAGDDAGAGSEDDPVATVARAMTVAAQDGLSRIAIGAGTFEASLDLSTPLVLQGCGIDETILTSSSADTPQVKVTGATGVEITGMTFDGGDRPLWFWGGAEVTVSAVTVERAQWSGFLVDGPYSLVDLRDVFVRNPEAVGGVGGYGLEIDGAIVTWEGGGVEGAVGAGIVVNGASARLSLARVAVDDTRATDSGQFGRGIQIQDYANATVSDSTFNDNVDAAMFSLLGQDVTVTGNTIQGGADGIVFTGIDAAGRRLDPATFASILDSNVLDGVSRAGVVFERVTAVANGTQIRGPQQHDVVAQEGAVFSGNDTVDVLVSPLALDRTGLAQVAR